MTGIERLELAEQAFASKDFAVAIEHAHAALVTGLDLDVPGSERGEYWAHPQTAQAELVLGMAQLELAERDEALLHLDRAVSLDKENMRTWANRGHVHRERGELELALADFEQALARDANYAYARFRRAQTLIGLHRYEQAEADLERLLSVNPYDATPLALWQSVRAKRGLPNDSGALPVPSDPDGLFRRAWVCIEHRDPERALLHLNAAYALNPQPHVLASLAHTHDLLGNLPAARANAEAYLRTDPDHAGMRGLLERIIERQRTADSARD
ncbi:MAG: tetratricopeptide repeat protein [Polyangiaceae bacterium]